VKLINSSYLCRLDAMTGIKTRRRPTSRAQDQNGLAAVAMPGPGCQHEKMRDVPSELALETGSGSGRARGQFRWSRAAPDSSAYRHVSEFPTRIQGTKH